MSAKAPPAAAAAPPAAATVQGVDIGQVLTSDGPTVTCVLLRHMRPDAKDVKPHPASPHVDATHKRVVLTELIEEIAVDTTPAKNRIRQILGPFTFVGQFPTEGAVAMAAKELPEDLAHCSVAKLRELCADAEIDTHAMLEKSELVAALEDSLLPVNPHRLQPPLHNLVVRGDILLMKVAETEETEDDEETAGQGMHVLPNEEFFLNYTKEEYVAFASRTDVVVEEVDDDDEEEDGGGKQPAQDDDDDDDEFDPSRDSEDPDEEEKCAMLNMIMAEVLRKFRADRGRGPTSEELLELRRQVATPLGVEVTTANDIAKRPPAPDEGCHASSKRVKFSAEAEASQEGDGSSPDNKEDEDSKPPASNGA
jgi:hypothetical protein